MIAYILRRLLLIPLTLFGIIALNFIIVQFAPGGPVEQVLAQLQGLDTSATTRVSSQSIDSLSTDSKYRGAQGLPPELVKEIESKFGFDKPPYERFVIMIKNYATLDFGESYFRSQNVIDIIIDKLPVSLSLGLWSTLLIYLISIPLGIRKAVSEGSNFDITTSYIIFFFYAMPSFLFSILLIVLFAGGQYFDLFPLRGLTSDNWDTLTTFGKIVDYIWHLILPVFAMAIGGIASLTMLTKNSFLDEINKQYVLTAQSKGLTPKRVLYGHVFRNAMLVVIAGFPATLVSMLFTGSLLIEVIFSLDGLGLLGFESIINRDYPVVFGTLFIFSLIGLAVNLLNDIMYHIVDPRIDFESRHL
ncbi:MAG: microcin ABC transporter permease [Alphaproteobacteria bacterium TMED87]|nr:microcin ABC transporter permease [Rhodospirillaceae bacterium]OUV09762.1 MAG: microcin ABC transporter permease [Alphaproteobacteria bacterium TMED87]